VFEAVLGLSKVLYSRSAALGGCINPALNGEPAPRHALDPAGRFGSSICCEIPTWGQWFSAKMGHFWKRRTGNSWVENK